MLEVGSQVERNENGMIGTVMGWRNREDREPMVEVRWPSGAQQWMPASHVTPIRKALIKPKHEPIRPAYMSMSSVYAGRKELANLAKRSAAARLADRLDGMGSTSRKHGAKQRTANKAKRAIRRTQNGRSLKPV